ncbi:MAG: DUF1318 domain-containing protein [Candidatus Omnitrophica bacterium]|nr:DUF1318 domain-containing protein [Candidatus Omnitrophota bacterium]
MGRGMMVLVVLMCAWGCARVQVEAPEEPIKVDISMRLDVYQHVQKDIDAIEDIVSGDADVQENPGEQSLLGIFLQPAYALEGFSDEVEAAALRRKERLGELRSLQQEGIVGENRLGLVEVREEAVSPGVQELVDKENHDRMLIYRAIASKGETAVENVQMLYAERLQGSAPAGTPVEDAAGWKIK